MAKAHCISGTHHPFDFAVDLMILGKVGAIYVSPLPRRHVFYDPEEKKSWKKISIERASITGIRTEINLMRSYL